MVRRGGEKAEQYGRNQLGVQLTQHGFPAQAGDAVQGEFAFPELED
jgi:hypothetical protein